MLSASAGIIDGNNSYQSQTLHPFTSTFPYKSHVKLDPKMVRLACPKLVVFTPNSRHAWPEVKIRIILPQCNLPRQKVHGSLL